jgi:uncharacterized protein (DUF427 family)
MSLTAVHGPLSGEAAGRFNFELRPPGAALYLDPMPYRIRAIFEGETVVDAHRPYLLHESGRLPVYYFEADELRLDLFERQEGRRRDEHKGEAERWTLRVGERAVPDAAWSYVRPAESAGFLDGLYALEWGAADEWFCEDEQLYGHPRDPYSRIDVYRTNRHLRVLLDGELLAETRRASALYETGLPSRYYIPAEDVRTELLVPSSHRSRCAYKGSASYWSVRVGDRLVDDLVWSYPDPEHDGEPVRDLLCFFNERVDLELDGEPVERPRTQFSRDDESSGQGAQALRGLTRS